LTKINISVDDKIEENFRNEVFRRKGMKRGNISKAFEEAMKLWIKQK